jgi:hypothetical protein
MAQTYMTEGDSRGKVQGKELTDLLNNFDEVMGEFNTQSQRIFDREKATDPRTRQAPTTGFDGNVIRTPEGRELLVD